MRETWFPWRWLQLGVIFTSLVVPLLTSRPSPGQTCNRNCAPEKRDGNGCCPAEGWHPSGSPPAAPPLPHPAVTPGTALGTADLRDERPMTSDAQQDQEGCRHGDVRACLSLADRYGNGRGVTADVDRAYRLRKVLCEAGKQQACVLVAWDNYWGRGTKKDVIVATQYFTKVCDSDPAKSDADTVANACWALGESYQYGWTGDKSGPRAVAYYDKSCAQLHNYTACLYLGRLYRTPNGLLPVDMPRAVEFLKKACVAVSNNAYCQYVGCGCNELGWVLHTGEGGVARDDAQAYPHFVEACNARDGQACMNAAEASRSGWGRVPDAAAAAPYFQKGCDLGWGPACNELGVMYFDGKGVAVDHSKALALDQAGCNVGDRASCGNLADFYWGGELVQVDHEKAMKWWSEACAAQISWACEKYNQHKGR
jgi:TPR repeat protein